MRLQRVILRILIYEFPARPMLQYDLHKQPVTYVKVISAHNLPAEKHLWLEISLSSLNVALVRDERRLMGLVVQVQIP